MQPPDLRHDAQRILRVCAAWSAALTLAACGAGGGAQAPASSAAPAGASSPRGPAPSTDEWAGRYVGSVRIAGTAYFGDALVTPDGALALYVGGPWTDDGTLQQSPAAGAMQLSGTLAAAPDHAAGQGTVLGENCAVDAPGRFCGAPGSATLTLAIASGNLVGAVTVRGAAGEESWSLELSPWTGSYVLPATRGALAGRDQELLAEFATDGDTLIGIDSEGNLSFHSPHSGCSGAGSLQPHAAGAAAVNVYDVHLALSGCGAAYHYLNAEYRGLATTSPSSVWDYDALLRMWLTPLAAGGQQGAAPALTTLANPQ